MCEKCKFPPIKKTGRFDYDDDLEDFDGPYVEELNDNNLSHIKTIDPRPNPVLPPPPPRKPIKPSTDPNKLRVASWMRLRARGYDAWRSAAEACALDLNLYGDNGRVPEYIIEIAKKHIG